MLIRFRRLSRYVNRKFIVHKVGLSTVGNTYYTAPWVSCAEMSLHDLCWYLCFQGSVQAILDRKNEMDNQAHICEQLGKANTFFVEFYDGFSHYNFKSNET